MAIFLSLRGVCDVAPLSGASAALAMTEISIIRIISTIRILVS